MTRNTTIAALAFTALTSLARGDDFYSVRTTTNELVRIGTDGHIVTVGSLGLSTQVTDADLAWHQGTLYMLDSVIASSAKLYTINPSNGSATFVAALGVNAGSTFVPWLLAESLASDGTSLYAVGTTASGTTGSTRFGPINLATGVVGAPVGIADADGMTYGPGGFWVVDSDTNANLAHIRSGNPPAGVVGTSMIAPVPNFRDLAFSGSGLFAQDQTGALWSVSTANGSLQQLTPGFSGNFSGLETTVPSPGTFAIAACALCAVHCRGRRRTIDRGSSST